MSSTAAAEAARVAAVGPARAGVTEVTWATADEAARTAAAAGADEAGGADWAEQVRRLATQRDAVILAHNSAQTAPKDGRVYRGYFERADPQGAMVKAVSWDAKLGWVDLLGHSVDRTWRLSAWSPE